MRGGLFEIIFLLLLYGGVACGLYLLVKRAVKDAIKESKKDGMQ